MKYSIATDYTLHSMVHESTHHHECLTEKSISEAEVKMQEILAQKTIGDILKEAHARH